MEYYKEIKLKDGSPCIIRSGNEEDAEGVLENFIKTHTETDNLVSYPDEIHYTAEGERDLLKNKKESPLMVELIAVVDGKIVGISGVDPLGRSYKMAHRANLGISVEKAYWGLGIGRIMTEACIECARKAGYEQLELEVVSENESAIRLYESVGFKEFGRNPKGFRSRETGYQELISMRLEL